MASDSDRGSAAKGSAINLTLLAMIHSFCLMYPYLRGKGSMAFDSGHGC